MSTPLPNPPFLPIPNIANLRSATHSLRTPSGPLRSGLLFRSGDVSKLDERGWSTLASNGVRHVFDLRSAPEVSKSQTPSAAGLAGEKASDTPPAWTEAMREAGVQRTWVPVFREQDYSPAGLASRYAKYMRRDESGFVAAYRDILENGGAAYRAILLYIAGLPDSSDSTVESAPRAALVHCTAGKDRTGIFFGVLFDFLRVPRGAIADEYNLTEQGLGPVREEVVARLLQSPGFQKYMLSLTRGKEVSAEDMAALVEGQDRGGEIVFSDEVLEEGRKAALRMIGARRESMLKALEMVDEEFGGSEAYLRTVCGLGDGDLEALRRVLIVSD